MMERGEPTLIPEWLKGVSGVTSGVVTNHSQPTLYQGDSGVSFSSRHRVAQQALLAGGSQGDHDSQHFLATSDRVVLPATTRRIVTSSGSINERLLSERESFSQNRPYFNSGRIFSHHIYDAKERDHDTSPRMQGDHDHDWDGEIDKDLSRDRGISFGTGDEKERECERLENGLSPRLENGLSRRPTTGPTGKYEADAVPRRSQASRLHDNGLKKMYETGNSVTTVSSSVSGSLATSMQKAAFERNFPSLGSDEKQGGPQSSLGNVSSVGPRPYWQGSPRPDIGRALSPGLTIGPVKSNGVPEGWSFTALAEAPVLNANMSSNGLALNVPPSSASSQTSATIASTPIVSNNVMNMAEALVQNSPRVRTPPQPFLESQKLEELALKQSRQLIPVIPSLPKTMGVADKGKPKLPSALKVSQPSKSCVLNSPHRSLVSVRSDTPKPAQGKLLVLKSGKDGASALSNAVKPDGIIPAQVTSAVNNAANGSNPGILGMRKQKQFIDSRTSLTSAAVGSSGVEGTRLRPWNNVMMLEDKRPLIQAQNRNEFFNALRKKAASNGVSSFSYEKVDSLSMQKNEQAKGVVSEPAENTSHSKGQNNYSEENVVVHNSVHNLEQIISEQHANGDTKVLSGSADGLILEVGRDLGRETTCSEGSEDFGGTSMMGGSEEEEAAFLRSLGWEENAEGGEALTEEEINTFYQMRAKSNVYTKSNLMTVRKLRSSGIDANQVIGSLGSISSGFSSSDSESDNEPRI